MLAWVGLADRASARPPTLSGGEQQRVAIARAVIARPELLVADEPTGNVDAAMAQRILHLLTALNRLGTTVVVATHDLGLIAATPGSQLIRLENGNLVDPTGALRNPPARRCGHGAAHDRCPGCSPRPPTAACSPAGASPGATPWLIGIMMFVMMVVAATGLALAGGARLVREGVAHRYSIQIADGRASEARAVAAARVGARRDQRRRRCPRPSFAPRSSNGSARSPRAKAPTCRCPR